MKEERERGGATGETASEEEKSWMFLTSENGWWSATGRKERKEKRKEEQRKEKERIYHELSFTKTTFMQLTFFFSTYSTWFEFTRFYKPFFFFFEMNSPTFLPLLFLSVGFSKSFSARLVWSPRGQPNFWKRKRLFSSPFSFPRRDGQKAPQRLAPPCASPLRRGVEAHVFRKLEAGRRGASSGVREAAQISKKRLLKRRIS